ncbi:hypothetical protein P170DRAFT_436501 [Aspergillus steynii IBT 23096]|uniref:Uncharacterized protein n=1 Tax=Aspergillus steynii IBT 23096 TaxID=1392250 RepID=A0A2I2G7D3_9EURO|nr:uncharacterized protein P170DRAFT_436501 [Aspergillus steynii IBT 23096]PLB48794.1 hypothetical protein P170DRAFT_436501 [Aspergillus steynii IBT 23096]
MRAAMSIMSFIVKACGRPLRGPIPNGPITHQFRLGSQCSGMNLSGSANRSSRREMQNREATTVVSGGMKEEVFRFPQVAREG